METNKQFTNEQIMAYAGRFKEGDAIYVIDNWREVNIVCQDDNRISVASDDNGGVINLGKSYSYAGIKELLKDSIDLIPNTDELLFENQELLETTKELLSHISKNIIQQKYKSKTQVQFETTLVSHKANEVKNIVVDILKSKGYKVESTIKTEQEGFSSVEYISTIELVVSW